MSILSFFSKNKKTGESEAVNQEKKVEFKASYLAVLGLILGTMIPTVLGAPIWLSLITTGLFGTAVGATVGMVVKGALNIGSSVIKIFNRKKQKKTAEKETKEGNAKVSILGKAKEKTSTLWQSLKEKVENSRIALHEKFMAKQDDQEENYEEEQDLEDKPSLKERFLSKFRRKKKKEVSDEVKNILKLDDDEVELEEGNKPIDTSKVDENKDLASTPVETQEINPLFTYRIKRSELRKPKYVIFDEIYEPRSLETMSNGHLSVNMDQFIETAKKRLEVLNEQLIRTQNEIAELENQIANTYTEPERKLVR